MARLAEARALLSVGFISVGEARCFELAATNGNADGSLVSRTSDTDIAFLAFLVVS